MNAEFWLSMIYGSFTVLGVVVVWQLQNILNELRRLK